MIYIINLWEVEKFKRKLLVKNMTECGKGVERKDKILKQSTVES